MLAAIKGSCRNRQYKSPMVRLARLVRREFVAQTCIQILLTRAANEV